jgi:hypothetical protein
MGIAAGASTILTMVKSGGSQRERGSIERRGDSYRVKVYAGIDPLTGRRPSETCAPPSQPPATSPVTPTGPALPCASDTAADGERDGPCAHQLSSPARILRRRGLA